MPDRLGYETLGSDLRCIDCGERRPAYAWRIQQRRLHHAAHLREGRVARERAARERAAQARMLARQVERENRVAYREYEPDDETGLAGHRDGNEERW